jgi:CRISPR type IV-associated protein Csf3
MIETGMTPDDAFAGYAGPKIDIPIPIADTALAGQLVALSSWAHPPRHALEAVRIRRRRIRADAMGGTSKIRHNAGPYKTAQLPTPVLVTPYLDFYVDGDVDLLRELLIDSIVIGRARGGGLGWVAGCEILARDGDVLVRDGRLTRAVPAGSVCGVDPSSYVEREATIRAPYWHRETRQMCWVPVLGAA